MASRKEIKKAILASVGNPESGGIAKSIDKMVDAVVALEAVKEEAEPEVTPEVKAPKVNKEIRIEEPPEIR